MLPASALNSMRVMFATPCYISAVTMNYVASIFSLALDSTHVGLPCILHLHSESLITRGRNKMIIKFLSEDFTHLFWIDSDIAFSSQAVFRLLLADRDVAAGVYPMKNFNWPAEGVHARDSAQATQAGAVAVGLNATGTNAIAIGTGAVATGSIAVGAGAFASNGRAAFSATPPWRRPPSAPAPRRRSRNSSAIGAERNRRQSDGVHWETHCGIASNGGADETRWYYGALADCFANIMPGRLSDRLSRAVKPLRELKGLSPSSVLPRCFPERSSRSLRNSLVRIWN